MTEFENGTFTKMNETIQPVDSAAPAVIEIGFLDFLIALSRHKKFVILFPICVSVIVLLISFAIPNVYRAGTKILPPQQAQGGAAALLAQLGGVAGIAAGAAGLKNPNDMYIGMLKSRTVADNLIKQFKLQEVYERDTMERTRKALENDTVISSGKDGMIVVEVDAHDRVLAAKMANAYIAELMKLTGQLALTEAAQRRVFFAAQLESAKNSLTRAETALKASLDTTGVISVDGQSRAIVETVAHLRAQVSAKEVELNAMQSFVTPNNSAHKRATAELQGLRLELSKLENGRAGANAEGKMSAAGLKNISMLRDVKYYEMLYELLAKQYEISRLDEAKDSPLIQVLDLAVTPERKVSPNRLVMLLVAAFLSLLFAIGWTFIVETKRRALVVPAFAAQWDELKRNLRMRSQK